MNYLFFDIECANVFGGIGKICEFGYVLTDESLTTLKHGVLTVDPDAPFDWYVKHKIISYPVETYQGSPKYPEVYREHIGELLSLPDTVYVGHGVHDDIKYLNNEAKRYSLPRFERTTVDASVIRKKFYGLPRTMSLKNIVKELGLGDPKRMHNSEYDATMTLEYVKVMCKESGLTFARLIEKYPKNTSGNTTP